MHTVQHHTKQNNETCCNEIDAHDDVTLRKQCNQHILPEQLTVKCLIQLNIISFLA
jgi:hypothetical protein